MPPTNEVQNTEILPQDDVELFGGEESGKGLTSGKEKVEPEKVKEPEKTKEKAEEKEEDKKEVKEEEKEELKEEEGLEVKTKPSWSKVSEKYPNFFKEFPEIRDALGREKAYNEIFESVEAAKEIKESSQDFSFFEEKVISGDAKSFLEVIKDTGKADLSKFVGNFLPALHEISAEMYLETTAPLFVDILKSMYNDAERAGNENLKNVALHAAKYLFNDHRFATGEVKIPEKKVEEIKKDTELSKEREAFLLERYQTAHNEVDTSCFSKLQDLIKSSLPEELDDYLAKHVTNDIISEIDKSLSADKEHINRMNLFWKQSEKTKFDLNSRLRIINNYLAKAKEVLPDIRRRILASAKVKAERSESRKEITGESRRVGTSRRPTSAKEIDWRQTSDEDFFSGNIKYKS